MAKLVDNMAMEDEKLKQSSLELKKVAGYMFSTLTVTTDDTLRLF